MSAIGKPGGSAPLARTCLGVISSRVLRKRTEEPRPTSVAVTAKRIWARLLICSKSQISASVLSMGVMSQSEVQLARLRKSARSL
jgi:hypothetical protein